jgi:16S rRNA (uracil1498-N3)-methyltransferase
MTHRFYAPKATHTGMRVSLPDSEAAHLTHALRLKVGATIQVFDGQGREFNGAIISTDRAGTVVKTLDPIDPAPEPKVAITLAQAVLKGRNFDSIIRDAVMLGVSVIQPLLTARTDVPEAALRSDSLRQRWEKIAIASSKQSGRAVVPVIESPISFDRHLSDISNDLRVILVEPPARPPHDRLDLLTSRACPRHATLTIGPEGGWSDDELNRARAKGWETLTLGSRTLRADAAPVVAITVLLYVWEEL